MIEYKAIFEMKCIDKSSIWNKHFANLPGAPIEAIQCEEIIVFSKPPTKEAIKILENEFSGKTFDKFKIISFRYLRTECNLDD